MPDAIKNAGMLVGIPGLVAMALICIHCMHMLVRCSRELATRYVLPYIRTYVCSLPVQLGFFQSICVPDNIRYLQRYVLTAYFLQGEEELLKIPGSGLPRICHGQSQVPWGRGTAEQVQEKGRSPNEVSAELFLISEHNNPTLNGERRRRGLQNQ